MMTNHQTPHRLSPNEAKTIRTLKIWLNAFIPYDCSGSKPVPNGIHNGKTLLVSPPPFTACFLTDQRHFSSDIDAPSRMHSRIEIDAQSGQIIRQFHRCGETVQVDPQSGEELCRDTASTDSMAFTEPEISDDGNIYSIGVNASSKNPCLELAYIKLSPNLDYHGTITVALPPDRCKGLISFDGSIEQYPAFEMYVSVNNAPPVTLFQEVVAPNSSPYNLAGPPTRSILHRVEVFPEVGISP